jgi:hypothetical protein
MFSNWASGVNVEIMDRPSPHGQPQAPSRSSPAPAKVPQVSPQQMARQQTVPQPQRQPPQRTEPLHPQSKPAQARPATPPAGTGAKQPPGPISHEQLSQWLKPAAKSPPPLPPEARGQVHKQSTPAETTRPKTFAELGSDFELLQREASTATPPQHHGRVDRHTPEKARTCPEATAALLLGIFAPFALTCSSVLSVLLAVVVIGLGIKARWKIAGEPGRYDGGTMASFAIFLGIVDIAIAMAIGRGCR